MKLYLLVRAEGFEADWDENVGFVIAAEGRSDARKLAAAVCAGRYIESAQTWLDAGRSRLTELGMAKPRIKRGIVLTSFKAG